MPRTDDGTRRGLGTFGGVFVPNVLTILGVIMFMRTGWVVGQSGLVQAFAILLIAKSITILTSLSLAAISTNAPVGAGGAYFLVSRSLGPEIGGAIGVPLYAAQAISVAFYLVGFAESLRVLMPGADPRVIGTVALAIFVGIAWFGAGVIAKAQYFILALLVASLLSIFTGFGPAGEIGSNLAPQYGEGHGFWTVFAIFFPAVTGIMAGVSMSGDLRDPARSIPVGTIAAVLVTFVVYAAQMIWLAARTDRAALIADPLVLLQIARVPALVYVGLWAATLSSALASLAGAPRTLQALALDRIAPRLLSRGLGRSREPHVALILTAIVAEACILAGDLNLIAPIISMFFLATYGTVNLVAGLERLVGNPSFRPTFRVHWALSLLGGIGCVAVMVLIDALATLVAAVVVGGIWITLARRRLEATWGDSRSGLWFAITRFALLRFVAEGMDPRNWRPVVLVLAGNPGERLRMIRFADWLESDRGFLFLAQVVAGDWQSLRPRRPALEEAQRAFIREIGISAVPKTVIADDLREGVSTLLQVSGIGPFQPNTVMVGWSDDPQRRAEFSGTIRRILELERNLVVFREARRDERGEVVPLDRRIDVWWYARDNGAFMATLAWLLRSHLEWRGHPIRVLRVIRDPAGIEDAHDGTAALIAELRVDAQVEIIASTEPPLEVIARASRDSAVCFVGISVSTDPSAENQAILAPYAELVGRLRGDVLLTKSWLDLEL